MTTPEAPTWRDVTMSATDAAAWCSHKRWWCGEHREHQRWCHLCALAAKWNQQDEVRP